MAIEVEYKDVGKHVEQIWLRDTDTKKRHLAYSIDGTRATIRFFPPRATNLREICIKGYKNLPRKDFAEKGYIKSGLGYYFEKKLGPLSPKSVTLELGGKNTITPKGPVIIRYEDFREMREGLARTMAQSKQDKTSYVDQAFHNLFPKHFAAPALSAANRARRLSHLLDATLIPHLGPTEIESLLKFVSSVLKTRYAREGDKLNLFRAAKLQVDEAAIGEVIASFERLLSQDPSEAVWGKFLEANLYLISSNYIDAVPQLNVMLAGSREPDFGLIDTVGYLDIFEIKKPSTKLLAKSTDRGNFVWSTDAVKALVQAEKYLFQAERKASSLAEDLRATKSIDVEIIRPRAILLIGNSNQLTTSQMRADFRVLRRSFKNVEVMLYDELLRGLKYQASKLFVAASVSSSQPKGAITGRRRKPVKQKMIKAL